MNKQWSMLIDLNRCVGCQSCTVSCKLENKVSVNHFRTWVSDIEVGTYPDTRRVFLPQLCNQCEKAPCIPVCPVKATWRNDEGIVVIDAKKCIGCGACVKSCPYGARHLDTQTHKADKCDLCAHRVAEHLLPVCVESCVGNARIFGDINDETSEIRQRLKNTPHVVLNKEFQTSPKVYYIGVGNTKLTSTPAQKSYFGS